jgi:putative NADPH-quinone reductase/putative sterol carrier protein
MKVLAINGSPRGAKGNTDRITQAFLEGAREAGAETETIYLKDKNIKHCRGCFTCWTKTPGVCIHKDDMPALLEKLRYADMTVYATPLYVFTVSGIMKDFMDRIIPLGQPFIVQRGHHLIHPPRYPEMKNSKTMLISNAGFPERHHFSGLEETFRRLVDNPDDELVGMICCAAGELLSNPALDHQTRWYLEAAKQAGRESVEQGRISSETQATLDRPLIDNPTVYANMANASWESFGVKQIVFDDETSSAAPKAATPGTPLSPPTGQDSMRDIVSGMAMVFNPQAAGDLEAVIQFEVGGEEPGTYYLDIKDGRCTAYDGAHPAPALTIDTPSEVWMAISRRELDGAAAMMSGKYSVRGDIGLLMRFGEFFSSASQS